LNARIALITSGDVTNIRAWSGTNYKIWKSLSSFADVFPLGPVDVKLARILGIPRKISARAAGKKHLLSQSIMVSRYFARVFRDKLEKNTYDLIFAPAASSEIAFLETRIPILYLSDTTFGLMIDYYEGFSNLTVKSIREANLLEARALEKAEKVILPTKWAANSAERDYNISRDKIAVIPFGANIDEAPDRNIAISRQITSPLRLLFLGVSWSRKGGVTAYRTAMELNRRGIDTVLTVCGCTPPSEYINGKVRCIPFLDKSKDKDVKVFNNLLLDSHFLILPTRAECSAIVFSEAAAFGLPVIATRTGGVPDVVEHSKTGVLIDLSDDVDGFADAISSTVLDERLYKNMVVAARDKYERELNWNRWTERVKQLVEEIL
jgi:glycosyltransferase involved in cell wall biosynthesis